MRIICEICVVMTTKFSHIPCGGDYTDGTWTALCLDAANGLLHYEGTVIEELSKYDAQAYTKFDFSETDTHHVRLDRKSTRLNSSHL